MQGSVRENEGEDACLLHVRVCGKVFCVSVDRNMSRYE